MEIGKRLAYFRKGKGYSVNKLANLSGVAQSYLREVELGNRNPTVEFLSIVCDTMGVSLRDFFDEQPAKIHRLTPRQRRALGDFLDTLSQ